MPPVSPFDVDPERVELLGASFTAFVNALLGAETGRASLNGYQLRTDSQTNTADGGVDAHISDARATDWLPPGDSAWQFKSGDLAPAACKSELEGARWARDLITAGASYRLVLGKTLGAEKIERRRKALRDKAVELNLLTAAEVDRIQVLDANSLARWAAEFPSIALGPMLGRLGIIQPFEQWSSSQQHQTEWVGEASRTDIVDSVRRVLVESTYLDMRIVGPSGIGKSRVVMETMRDQGFTPLVAYVPDAEEIDSSVISALVQGGSSVVLVVDECSSRRHKQLAEQLPVGSSVRLVTIGQEMDQPLKSPAWPLPELQEETLSDFLTRNHAALSEEARRLVLQYANGNVGFADLLADRVRHTNAGAIADLINSGDINQLLALTLPDGGDFLVAQTLALFERVGFDGELGTEADQVAELAGISARDIRSVARRLERQGVVERQGRYRAIAPQPLAVYLAATAWRESEGRIVGDVLPDLSPSLRTALFRRAAELGRFEPASGVLARLLDEGALLGSLGSIDDKDASELLIHLAVLAPEDTMRRLGAMIESEPLESLRAMTGIRRNLVWALEKLAWHSRTFEQAADALLRLALAENETYGNNATGIWLSFFAAILPATAAPPDVRSEYLTRHAESTDLAVRGLVVRACGSALQFHESVMVSGENQGGALVEPRGRPATWQDVAAYRRIILRLLRTLADDHDQEVADAARKALLGTIHPFLDDPLLEEAVRSTLLSLSDADLANVRDEVEKLITMRRRVERRRDEEDERRAEDERIMAALESFRAQLPAPNDFEALQTLASRSPWELDDDDDARERLKALVQHVASLIGLDALLDWLVGSKPASEWFVGHALHAGSSAEEALRGLVARMPDSLVALSGYLTADVDAGSQNAFDDFLDGSDGQRLEASTRLAMTVRGPQSEAAVHRVVTLLQQLPITPAAYTVTPWLVRLPDEPVSEIIADWVGRIDSQEAYNAVVDAAALRLHGRETVGDELQALLLNLVPLRLEYPSLANARWDWARLAEIVASVDAPRVANLILDLVSADHGLVLIGSDDESVLLGRIATMDPEGVWQLIAERLEAGDWRVTMMLRGWFLYSIPVDIVGRWIGDSLERARLVASIAGVGDEEPSPYAELLLTRFPEDDKVAGSLAGDFSSGSWTGPWSDRVRRQIATVERWAANSEYSAGVRGWAERMIPGLRNELDWSLQREAEERR